MGVPQNKLYKPNKHFFFVRTTESTWKRANDVNTFTITFLTGNPDRKSSPDFMTALPPSALAPLDLGVGGAG